VAQYGPGSPSQGNSAQPTGWRACCGDAPAFGPASSAAQLGGSVKVGAPMAGLPDKAAHRVSADEAEGEGDLADRPGPFLTVELELVGDTATLEQVEAGAGEADPGPHLTDPLITSRPGLIREHPGDLGTPELAGAFQHDLDGVHADPVGVEREPGPPVADEYIADSPAGGSSSIQGSWLADGTAWAIRTTNWVPGSPRYSQ
jgi:hypothetical protein